jgi:uncharacterized protein YyaL (SSP411 family)
LYELTGERQWRDRAEELARAFAGRARDLGLYAATYLLAVDWLLNPTAHLVIVGGRADLIAAGMHQQALARFLPRRLIQLVEPDQVGRRPLPAAMKGMVAAATSTRGYACTGFTCSRPAEDVAEWIATLEALRAPAVASSSTG